MFFGQQNKEQTLSCLIVSQAKPCGSLRELDSEHGWPAALIFLNVDLSSSSPAGRCAKPDRKAVWSIRVIVFCIDCQAQALRVAARSLTERQSGQSELLFFVLTVKLKPAVAARSLTVGEPMYAAPLPLTLTLHTGILGLSSVSVSLTLHTGGNRGASLINDQALRLKQQLPGGSPLFKSSDFASLKSLLIPAPPRFWRAHNLLEIAP